MLGIIFVILLLGGIILFFQKKDANKMKKIIESKPKHRFQYLDTFYYYIVQNDSDGGTKIPFYYFVLMEEGTNQVYVIDKTLFRNAWYASFFGKEMQLYKGKIGSKDNVVQFYDRGNFWIDEELNNFYQNDGRFITLNNTKLIYSKYQSEATVSGYGNDDENIPILYNFNPNYDSSLFNNAKFITGVVEFDITNNNPL